MSAPDTEVEKQTRRHRPSLVGIALAVIAAIVAVAVFSLWDPVPRGEQAAPALAPAPAPEIAPEAGPATAPAE